MELVKIKSNESKAVKIFFIGENYEKTKSFDNQDLVYRIKLDLDELSNEHCELEAGFEVEHCDDPNIVEIKFTSDNCQAYTILIDEIDKILWSFNKQIITQGRSGFKSRFLRFTVHRQVNTP